MGRCRQCLHIFALTSFCLLLQVTLCQADLCIDAEQSAIEKFYKGDISDSYTCIDKHAISHGKGCTRKCNAVIYGLQMFGCDPSFASLQCSVKQRRKRQYLSTSECNIYTPICSPHDEYRSMDGSCNNLRNPLWGKSHRIQNRIVPNAYDDAISSPRTMGCSGQLPSPRAISNIINEADETMVFDERLSYMMMQFGQFLAHDLVLTELITRSDGEALHCCMEDKDNPECFSIQVPLDDPFFTPGGCMSFGRSLFEQDCNGVRQQINSQTSYLDLSVIYGETIEAAGSLRAYQGGKLNSAGNSKLPVDMKDELCELSRPQHIPSHYCPRSGDERVNEQPGLASLHTVFMREHNRLVDGLSNVNPHWDDERLYQEARKINIAQWQNIVYSEYLPLVLGPHVARQYNLEVARYGYKDTYNPLTDATVFNSFAAAGLRFGHTMIHRHVSMMSFDRQEMITPRPLSTEFLNPDLYHSNDGYGLEHVLLWTSTTKCPFNDRHLEPSIQKHLFQDKNNDSMDLASLNVQRGRDHGIPGYNTFRQECGLSKVSHFGTDTGGLVDHEPHVADLLSQVYSCPDDIDLFTGHLSERRSPGSILGPTGQCIIAKQFKRLRDGDRFFFERSDYHQPWIGFTPAQLMDIKRVKLSTLLCLNTSFENIQETAFIQPEVNTRFRRNNMVSCHTLRGINFNLWRDRF